MAQCPGITYTEEPVGEDADEAAGAEGDGQERPTHALIAPPRKSHPNALAPERWQAARKAYIEGGLTVTETACVLGTTRGAVQGHVDRGRWTELRKQHKEEVKRQALQGVDEQALERRKAREEKMRVLKERTLENADAVGQTCRVMMANWVECHKMQEAAREKARAAGEDDPGPYKAKCPIKLSDVNALMQAVTAMQNIELKDANLPTEHSRVDMVAIGLDWDNFMSD